jgi:hypothetical protein
VKHFLAPRVDAGVKTASPEIATVSAEMGSGATEETQLLWCLVAAILVAWTVVLIGATTTS